MKVISCLNLKSIALFTEIILKEDVENIKYIAKSINIDGEVLFRIKVSLAHPVDLYALMDLTGSMGTHKRNLGIAAQAIADALKTKTDIYRFAYGSFRDKPRLPFGSSKHF